MNSIRFSGPRRLAAWVAALLAAGWLTAVIWSIVAWFDGLSEPALVVFGVSTGLLLLGLLLLSQVLLQHRAANLAFRNYDLLLDLLDLARRRTEHSRTVAENSALSDWAKKIVFREKDHDFLSDAIQGLIVRQEWDAVEQFIRTLESEFGQREEAAQLRAQVAQARQATVEERVTAALARFETLCGAQKWEQAEREVVRLRAIFPGDERISRLTQQVGQRRRLFKNFLLREYDQAIRVHDVDGAHRLLFELDRYLTPSEAAALKESARGVFKAKLLQEGVQFSLAVSDRQFDKALEVGERICREFPNSRYAREIQAMMPHLRRRANGSPRAAQGQNGAHEPVGAA
ncbi:MAG: hypothetical protein LC135_00050 [Phycisphaerae bacterium]|jgi:flagellar biosynthesis chaperone FliJ|nr:hypothetical protein [Phycisphaerae bacterium]MCZ2398244.1 hypothetical protein [Phycisphaerae bacterium]NUQ49363.1 hypothetical protein [Phycisphaerae bacterium]